MFGILTTLDNETENLHLKAIAIDLSYITGRLMNCENLRRKTIIEEQDA